MLKVFYGYSRLTPKTIKKAELAIYFENADNNPTKNEAFINRRITVVHTRYQTKEELTDAAHSNRMFTKYSYFIDDKPFFSDIDKVLACNFEADKNHVKLAEREEIKKRLREEYYRFFNRKEIQRQLRLF